VPFGVDFLSRLRELFFGGELGLSLSEGNKALIRSALHGHRNKARSRGWCGASLLYRGTVSEAKIPYLPEREPLEILCIPGIFYIPLMTPPPS